MIVEIESKGFRYDDNEPYWVVLKLLYYLVTDLTFIVMLNVIVKTQEHNESEFLMISSDNLSFADSVLNQTFEDS